MQIQPKVDVESITVGSHESSYTSGEVLKGMDTTNAKHPTPYAFYYRYLNQVIKNRLANEMTIGLTPLIAKRLQQTFRKTVLFPENVMAVPKSVVTVTPGIQVSTPQNTGRVHIHSYRKWLSKIKLLLATLRVLIFFVKIPTFLD